MPPISSDELRRSRELLRQIQEAQWVVRRRTLRDTPAVWFRELLSEVLWEWWQCVVWECVGFGVPLVSGLVCTSIVGATQNTHKSPSRALGIGVGGHAHAWHMHMQMMLL